MNLWSPPGQGVTVTPPVALDSGAAAAYSRPMSLKLVSLFGLAVFIGVAWAMSSNRKLFPWRTVLANATLPLEVQGVPKEQARATAREQLERVAFARQPPRGFPAVVEIRQRRLHRVARSVVTFDLVHRDAQPGAFARAIGVDLQRFAVGDELLGVEPAALRAGFIACPPVEPQLRQREPLLGGGIALVALALGLTISVVARTQLLANQMAMVIGFLPTFLLSGFTFVISNMPVWLQAITYVIAPRYYVSILKEIFLKGVGFSFLWRETLALIVFAVVGLWVATRSFKKELK